MRSLFLIVTFLATSGLAQAEAPNDFLIRFERDAGSKGSAERGLRFFTARHGSEWSCASCHTDNPTQSGKHAKTDKVIKPLAPSANAERFTDTGKVDKWFRRNCNDTLGRECNAQEKADVLAWLTSFKR